MSNQYNIKSAQDYIDLVIGEIREGLNELHGTDEEIENKKEIYIIWFEKIKELCEELWELYITGNRESFMMDEAQFEKTYNDSVMEFTQSIIDGLSDKGMVQTVIRADGSIAYQITEEGRKHVDDHNKLGEE